jgi:hypothetical protein
VRFLHGYCNRKEKLEFEDEG